MPSLKRKDADAVSYGLCQRCGDEHTESWNIKQAELHVGRLEHWKVQLCPLCLKIVEQAILAALRPEGR